MKVENRGGSRQGAGRKPKAQEQKLIERLDAIIDKDEALSKLGELVAKGDMRAVQLYLSYRYGKPKEMQQIDVNTKVNIPVIDFARPKTIDVTPENERIDSDTNEIKD